MGQKVNKIAFRLGGLQTWKSKWYANKHNYPILLQQDVKMRRWLKIQLRESLVNRIEIERSSSTVTITIHAAKPGIIIGRGGAGIEKLQKTVRQKFLKNKISLEINVQELRQPNQHAAIVVQTVINDLERRMPFRRVIKQALGRVQRENVKGVKIMVKGRLNGADIARTEYVTEGSIPLHTIRADIDYSRGVARTTYGAIGVKVWIFKGEIFEKDSGKAGSAAEPGRAFRGAPGKDKKTR